MATPRKRSTASRKATSAAVDNAAPARPRTRRAPRDAALPPDEETVLQPRNEPAPVARAAGLAKSAYFNRELSWLAFNRRVLEQAQNPRHPLLERVRFLAIVSGNLDEFFEIRVAGLIQQVDNNVVPAGGIDIIGPREQLRRIHGVVASLVDDQYRCWRDQLLPALAAEGITFADATSLTSSEFAWVRTYFEEQIFPVLTPLAIDQSHPFPQLGNKTLNIVV